MIRTAHAHLPVFAVTNAGQSGKDNEDRYAVSAFQLSAEDATPVLLAVLADGIGGHRAGEVAAEIAVEAVSQQVAEGDGHQPLETLAAAIQQANQKIFATAQSNESRTGMGSTCSCAVIINNRLYTATVGDSRIYLLRGGDIIQLSTDHTWIQEALERGILTPEQARGHPNQHVIRRYLGSPNPPIADFRMRLSSETEPSETHQGLPLLPGDRLLLCSDGLTDLVSDAEILHTLDSNEPSAALQALVNLANARGGHDNITIVLLHAPEQVFLSPRRPGRTSPALRAVTAVVLLALLAAAVWGIVTLVNSITALQPTPTPSSTPAPLAVTPPQTTLQTTLSLIATSALVVTPAAPIGSPSPAVATLPPPTLTPAVFSTRSGATITPWPTNTLKP